MMTSEDIRQLLQRFYDGETTHAEEHSLREWFRTNDCSEDLQPDRQMVMALSETADVPMPVGLQMRISNRLRKRERRRHQRAMRWLTMTGIAASVAALAIGVWYWMIPQQTVYADTCQTPQEAIEEVHQTLNIISRDLCQGLSGEEDLGGPMP